MNRKKRVESAIELLPFGQYSFITLFGKKDLYIKSIGYDLDTLLYTIVVITKKKHKSHKLSLDISQVFDNTDY